MLEVQYRDGGEMVSISPPDSLSPWGSPGLLTPTQILAELARLGCHSTAIIDALDGTGTDWRALHDAEVAAGRNEQPDDPRKYFNDLGFQIRVEGRDLHAECLASGEVGRATFFVAGRTYYCVDLLRGDRVVAPSYGYGETVDTALARAKARFESDQR